MSAANARRRRFNASSDDERGWRLSTYEMMKVGSFGTRNMTCAASILSVASLAGAWIRHKEQHFEIVRCN